MSGEFSGEFRTSGNSLGNSNRMLCDVYVLYSKTGSHYKFIMFLRLSEVTCFLLVQVLLIKNHICYLFSEVQ